VSEIKLRAWDKEANSWLEAVTLTLHMSGCLINLPPNIELTEWTGLQDKHGKDIFEGDIVRHSNGTETSLIEDIHAFCGECGIYGDNPRDVEIIGNVYEQPELLKEVQS